MDRRWEVSVVVKKMEATGLYEKSVFMYLATQHWIPEEGSRNSIEPLSSMGLESFMAI
jgi:hypothetical protein